MAGMLCFCSPAQQGHQSSALAQTRGQRCDLPKSREACCGSASPTELIGGLYWALRNSPTALCSSALPSSATRVRGGVISS